MEELSTRVAAHLSALGAPALRSLEALGGGACQELFRVALADESVWVLRSDAPRSLPGSLGRVQEFQVVAAAVAAGVKTPAPRWLSSDLLRAEAGAYFLPWRQGEALGGRVVRHPSLERARAGLCAELTRELAKLQAVTPGRNSELLAALGPPPADPARAAIETLAAMIERLPQRRPALELALLWLRERCPAPCAPSLVHGDFRVGNFLVEPEGLSAILDWEFAHWGDPVEDLGWLCGRDWRFGREDLAAGGIATREQLLSDYLAAGGAPVDRGRLRFWEVYGDARWAAGARFQSERYLSGAQPDLELLAIGWRALELEYELLRQIGDLDPEPPQLRPSGAGERPDASALLAGVARFLEDELGQAPALAAERGLAFRLKIASSLLRSLAHEGPEAAGLAAAEAARFSALLGRAPEAGHDAGLAPLEAELCRRAREDPPSSTEQARWRAAVGAGLAARLRARNPRFERRKDLP